MESYNNSLIKGAKIIIDWELICDEFNLEYGDISFEQSLKIDNAIDSINEVIHEFIMQNKKLVSDEE
tara:strand:- start:1331 stop:1531 length:201 start_codon:yes stop_codon:yes gene_type:complete